MRPAAFVLLALLAAGAPAQDTDGALARATALQDRALALAESGRPGDAADAFLEAAPLFGEAGRDEDRAKCLHNAGALYTDAGRHEESVDAFARAQTWCARVRKASWAASSVYGRALALAALDREGEAVEAFAIAVALFEQLGDDGQLAIATHDLGASLANLRRFDESAETFLLAERRTLAIGDLAGAAMSAESAGTVLRSAERHAESAEALDRAVARRLPDDGRPVGGPGTVGGLLRERGTTLLMLNRWDDALADFEAAAPMLEAAGDASGLAWLHWHRGQTLRTLGRYEEAVAAFDASERLAAGRDPELLANLLLGRADVLVYRGRLSESLEVLEEASALVDLLAGPPGSRPRTAVPHGLLQLRGSVATRRGEVLRNLGHFGDALAELAAAEEHHRASGKRAPLAAAILDRAELLAELGRQEEALAGFDEAGRLFAELGDAEWGAHVEIGRATALRLAGEPRLALDALRRARPVVEGLGNARQVAHMDFERVILLRTLGRTGHAEELLEEIEEGFVAYGGRVAEARAALEHAALHHLAGRDEDALAEAERADLLWEAEGHLQQRVRSAAMRGDLLAGLGRDDEALDAYDVAVDGLEALLVGRTAGLGAESVTGLRAAFAEIVPPYLALAAARAADADVARAWRVVEVFQGLGAAQLVAERGRLRDDALPPDVSRTLRDARRALSEAADAVVGDAAGDDDAGRAELAERRRELARAEDDARLVARAAVVPEVASLAEVAAALGSGETLVQYAALGARVHALVVSADGARLVPIGPSEAVDAAVERVLDRLDPGRRRPAPLPAELAADLRALGRLVLDPVLAGRAPPARLVVVPSGLLCRVPFGALLTADVAPGAEQAAWPFLAAAVDTTCAHSGTTWIAMRRRADAPRDADGPAYVAFADPEDASVRSRAATLAAGAPSTHDGAPAGAPGPDAPPAPDRGPRGLASLPRTIDEVAAVARLFAGDGDAAALDALEEALLVGGAVPGVVSGDDFLLLLRGRATEAQLRRRATVRGARVLHLACHGAADPVTPGLSRLELGRAGTEDGRLFTDELATLDLSCELLVLSACETNAGPLRALEGVDGLTRAGLAAGARAVLSTLWRVPDDGARRLVTSFHEAWLGEGLPRARALGEARRRAIREGLPVRAWAAFQLWDGAPAD